MRIGFHAGAINERGMSVAVHDYGMGVKTILGHEPIVFYAPTVSDPAVVEKFRADLTLVGYDPTEDFRAVTEPHKLDFCYFLNSGNDSRLRAAAPRTGVHAVFRHFEPNGDVYAYVSDWLAEWMTGGAAPAVPHIVDLPEPTGTLRGELGIPADGFVVGRYGGYDQFNVPFAKAAVVEALERRTNLYFLFVNTEPFIDHPRVLFLPPIIRPGEKANFIASCDVGLNAKKIGESFGLAIAEFMAFGKPVFSWAGGMDQNHVRMTPDRDWIYRTRRGLTALLSQYQPSARDADLAKAATLAYTPAKVMARFDEVFLSGRHDTHGLTRTRSFEIRRLVEEKAMRAKFKLWKSV